ncbi:uncharacterized protein VP01_1436g3 [Puccinia sorghi]|uniref:Uncharacterized protein n=1 Tax=Puccinia sorghi TaxID=27349 RepID=A0A0L6VKH4_9BASI|nr:uncharacterized protein VP01_1436g3 [Puccinia sorghi]
MLVIPSFMLSLLVSIQASNAEVTGAKGEPIMTMPPPSSGGNTTADAVGAMASGVTQSTIDRATAVANVTASAATNATNFMIATLVDNKSCGSATSHINACLVRSCMHLLCHASTNCWFDTPPIFVMGCLRNYANLATCYGGCPNLSSQGVQYKSMSTQHCEMPGVAEKVKAAAAVKNNTTTTTSRPSGPSDAPTPKMSAKSAASNSFQLSALALVTGFSAALAHLAV